MNKNNNLPTSPAPTEVDKLVKELHAAVAALPIEKHVEPVELLNYSNPRPVQELQIQAEDIIRQLSILATYGSHDAIRVLRDLGNRAAESLLSFFPDSHWTDEALLPPAVLRVPKNQNLLKVRLKVNMGPVNKIILEKSITIWESSKDEILECYRQIAGTPDIRIKVVVPVDSAPWPHLLAGARPSVRNSQTQVANSDEDLRQLEAISAINIVVTRMIESRLSTILVPRMHEAAETVASYSMVWPVPVPAIEDRRPEAFALVKALPLGKILPFRLARKNGSGNNRDFSKGPTALATGYCVKLFAAQLTFATLSADDRATLKSIDEQLDSDRLASRWKASYSFMSGNRKWHWDRWTHWELKAAFLPDYPKVSKPRNAMEEAQFNEWLNAAMLLAESDCNGDWEHYSWPVDIVGQGDRKAEAEVRQILRKGMKKLQLESQEI